MLHRLPYDLLELIGSYVLEPLYKLKPEFQDIDWDELSMNPRAMHMIEENPDKVNNYMLCMNPAAVPYLEKHPEKINWHLLSSNPAAIHLLEKHLDKVDKSRLCLNPAAIHLLEQHPSWINWMNLCSNPAALPLIMAHPNQWRRRWSELSRNPAFFPELLNHREHIDWSQLCGNPAAVPFIYSQFPHMTEFQIALGKTYLSENPAAIPFLIEHPEYIEPHFLSTNPALLTCGNQTFINDILRQCNQKRFRSGYSRHPEIFEIDHMNTRQAIYEWICLTFNI